MTRVHILPAFEVLLIFVFFLLPTVSVEKFIFFNEYISPLILLDSSLREGDSVLMVIILSTALVLPIIRCFGYQLNPASIHARSALFFVSRLVLLEPVALGCIVAIAKFKSSLLIEVEVGFFILLFACLVSVMKDTLLWSFEQKTKLVNSNGY